MLPASHRQIERPPGDRTIIAIIPAFNEERFIGSVALTAGAYVTAVLVVDDGSTDRTADVAEAAGCVVIRHGSNLGKGAALNTGFRKARELGADAVVTLDADGQHRPEELVLVVTPILDGRADIVVGSRYLELRSQVPLHRTLGHRVFNLLTRRFSGVSSTDSQSGFRAFSDRALQTLCFRASGFAVESEMQFLAHDHGLRLLEIPITIVYHQPPKRPVLAHGWLVLNGILRIVGQYRPLLFFGGLGLIFLLAGLGSGALVVEIYRASQILATGYALVSVLLTLIGTVALFSGIVLHSVRGLLLGLIRPVRE